MCACGTYIFPSVGKKENLIYVLPALVCTAASILAIAITSLLIEWLGRQRRAGSWALISYPIRLLYLYHVILDWSCSVMIYLAHIMAYILTRQPWSPPVGWWAHGQRVARTCMYGGAKVVTFNLVIGRDASGTLLVRSSRIISQFFPSK